VRCWCFGWLGTDVRTYPQLSFTLPDLVRQVLDHGIMPFKAVVVLFDGASQLPDCASQLPDGSLLPLGDSSQLAEPVVVLLDGASQLPDGSLLPLGGVPQLPDGNLLLSDGAGQLRDGTSQIADGVRQQSNVARWRRCGRRSLLDRGSCLFHGRREELRHSFFAIDEKLRGFEVLAPSRISCVSDQFKREGS